MIFGTFFCFYCSLVFLYFRGVFNKTIIPLALVGYEMIIANSALPMLSIISYPTSASGIIVNYYSTNCNTIQILSGCSRYLSSVGNRYPAVYVASYVGRKSEVKKMSTERFKNVTRLVINLLNNKTIIVLNLAEYRLILADSAYGLVD